jgi:hypothetical protein
MNTTTFSGPDSIMSVQFQVTESLQNAPVLIDSIIDKQNIYGIDQYSKPIDRNKDINLYQTKIPESQLSSQTPYYFRVRYRDTNLKWSNWSDSFLYITTGIKEEVSQSGNSILYQNFPNPFQNSTTIKYTITERSEVIFRIYDANNRQVDEINEGVKNKGTYHFDYKAETLSGGIYFYKMIAKNQCVTKKMIKVQYEK